MDPFEVLGRVLPAVPALPISLFFAQWILYSPSRSECQALPNCLPFLATVPISFNAELVKFQLIQNWNLFTNCLLIHSDSSKVGHLPRFISCPPSVCHLVFTMAASSPLGAGVRRGQGLSGGETHAKEISRRPLRLCFRILSVVGWEALCLGAVREASGVPDERH